MFESLRRKIEARKEQERQNRLQKEAARRLKDFDVKISLEDDKEFFDGRGTAKVNLKNKVSGQEAEVVFSGCRVRVPAPDIYTDGYTVDSLSVEMFIAGKKVMQKRKNLDGSVLEKIEKMDLPQKPYDIVYQMAVNAVMPELKNREDQMLTKANESFKRVEAERQKKEQAENEVKNKMISDFLGYDR